MSKLYDDVPDFEKIRRELDDAAEAAYKTRNRIMMEEIEAGRLGSYRSHPAYIEAHRAYQAGEKALIAFDREHPEVIAGIRSAWVKRLGRPPEAP